MQWRTVCHQYLQSNPGKVITKFNFNIIFKAWLSAVTSANVIAGFHHQQVVTVDLEVEAQQ